MTTIHLSAPDAWLLATAITANLVLGFYHLTIVLDEIRHRNVRPVPALMLGFAYGAPFLALVTISVRLLVSIRGL